MRLPSSNKVTLKYGATAPLPYTATNKHAGTDYSHVPDGYAYAPERVVVTRVGDLGDCGYSLDYQSVDNQRFYRNCHAELDQIYGGVGQEVAEGYRLSKMGATGNATGAHLHFVMWSGVKDTAHRVDGDAEIKRLIAQGDTMSTTGEYEFHALYEAEFGPMDRNPPTPDDRKRWIGRETNTVIREMEADPRHPAWLQYIRDQEADTNTGTGDFVPYVPPQQYVKKEDLHA